jgi:Sec23/Sec24 zinc finger
MTNTLTGNAPVYAKLSEMQDTNVRNKMQKK